MVLIHHNHHYNDDHSVYYASDADYLQGGEHDDNDCDVVGDYDDDDDGCYSCGNGGLSYDCDCYDGDGRDGEMEEVKDIFSCFYFLRYAFSYNFSPLLLNFALSTFAIVMHVVSFIYA